MACLKVLNFLFIFNNDYLYVHAYLPLVFLHPPLPPLHTHMHAAIHKEQRQFYYFNKDLHLVTQPWRLPSKVLGQTYPLLPELVARASSFFFLLNCTLHYMLWSPGGDMRKIIMLIRVHGLLSRAHGLLNRAHELVNRAHGLLNRAHGLLSRANPCARLSNPCARISAAQLFSACHLRGSIVCHLIYIFDCTCNTERKHRTVVWSSLSQIILLYFCSLL